MLLNSIILLSIKKGSEILPGWTLDFDEVSNNVYKVSLTDNFGRQGSTTDTSLEEAIITCERYAFDIEKQISKNWGKFLYDTCILKLGNKPIIEKHYYEESFGSWIILLTDNRILFDNRDNIFCIQLYENDWVNVECINIPDLTFDIFNSFTLSAH